MTVTAEEMNEIKLKQEYLERSVADCVLASKKSSEASEKVANQISKLLSEMRVRDERHKHEREAFKQLEDKVDQVDGMISDYIDTKEPIISRARKSQERFDKFWDAFISKGGQAFFWVASISLLVLSGIIPLSKITGG